ncbi:MAG TPA: bifunctional diaminohydroxyphosphoribosylaminopyrimidine deaminase/5-amino-6-(5-phosphoribosylamino)uracil reductase RibD [Pyrinomonadaceae bacterium]|nr:bifunctional diaminohydroxyphosphoribosylaminopyrimidine deaminase/5-amino-6-(5-phosphoribosylamino)uracil reductase RibD [Pyrinomonadaceae bacterium]HMP66666.1 bifunctional diaminohydroxyphosphoribosylaminopyrimidine deaminase/5-amino-6-(5-phosphoribosylamino)uracil reductase RibD [Pyrinomonadaceae bacterium]
MNDIRDKDRNHLARALELARGASGLVSPNPLVGCVIVSTRGDVVGEGAYIADNVTHAEVLALEQAGERARGGTAYVSLEPHAHHGRTPPCTEALINAGVRRVVCPIEDPNPLVSGRGFERLKEAGIEVATGILADEATRLNEKFICWHKKGRPFVHLKLAMSLDGRISLKGSVSTALSGEEARRRVQEIRHEHDAILIGATTAVVDNPSLTDRSGLPRRRPLARVVLDNSLRLPVDSKLAATTDQAPTIVMTNCIDPELTARLSDRGVEIIPVDKGARNLEGVLEELKRREIQSVLVEGGTAVAGAFVDARLVDKVTFMIAPLIVGGSEAPAAVGGRGIDELAKAMRLRDTAVFQHGEDIEITGYPKP